MAVSGFRCRGLRVSVRLQPGTAMAQLYHEKQVRLQPICGITSHVSAHLGVLIAHALADC